MSVEIVITKHAKEKMALHGITNEQVKIAIKHGAKVNQTDGFLASYTYIKVAYKKVAETTYKIKTVFVE